MRATTFDYNVFAHCGQQRDFYVGTITVPASATYAQTVTKAAEAATEVFGKQIATGEVRIARVR